MTESSPDTFEEADPTDGPASGTGMESVEEIRQALAKAQ